MQSFKGFQNPFEMTGEDSPLVSLSSGLQASKQVEDDMLTLQEVGRKQHQSFIKERLVTKSTSFHAPIKRNRKQIFASLSKTTSLKTSQKQELKLKAQRNVFGQLLMLSEKHHLDLQKVIEYPLGPVPWSLATADGMPIKMDKAALMTKLEEESSYKYPEKKEIMYMSLMGMHCSIISPKFQTHLENWQKIFSNVFLKARDFISSQTTTMICLSKHQRG